MKKVLKEYVGNNKRCKNVHARKYYLYIKLVISLKSTVKIDSFPNSVINRVY